MTGATLLQHSRCWHTVAETISCRAAEIHWVPERTTRSRSYSCHTARSSTTHPSHIMVMAERKNSLSHDSVSLCLQCPTRQTGGGRWGQGGDAFTKQQPHTSKEVFCLFDDLCCFSSSCCCSLTPNVDIAWLTFHKTAQSWHELQVRWSWIFHLGQHLKTQSHTGPSWLISQGTACVS